MKIRDEWKGSFEQESPPALDARVLKAAHAEMRSAPPEPAAAGWGWLFAPVLGAACAVALVGIWVSRHPALAPHAPASFHGVAVSEMPEMLLERKLLLDLKVLQHDKLWEKIEKQAWKKAKS